MEQTTNLPQGKAQAMIPKEALIPLGIEKIKMEGTQTRTSNSEAIISEYAQLMEEGCTFPPAEVFLDDQDTYWLSDGHHRVLAAVKAKRKEITVLVKHGDKRDAILASIKTNSTNGLRMTKQDKRQAVKILLQDEKEWANKPNTEIARFCGVDEKTVRNAKKELEPKNITSESPKTAGAKKNIIRNGKAFEMNTSNIGKLKPLSALTLPLTCIEKQLNEASVDLLVVDLDEKFNDDKVLKDLTCRICKILKENSVLLVTSPEAMISKVLSVIGQSIEFKWMFSKGTGGKFVPIFCFSDSPKLTLSQKELDEVKSKSLFEVFGRSPKEQIVVLGREQLKDFKL